MLQSGWDDRNIKESLALSLNILLNCYLWTCSTMSGQFLSLSMWLMPLGGKNCQHVKTYERRLNAACKKDQVWVHGGRLQAFNL